MIHALEVHSFLLPMRARLWPMQSHEALRGEHRLQNREFLREHMEPLAYLLSSDACYGVLYFSGFIILVLLLTASIDLSPISFRLGKWNLTSRLVMPGL